MRIGSSSWTDYTVFFKGYVSHDPYIGRVIEQGKDFYSQYHPSGVQVRVTISDEAKLDSVNRFFDPAMHAGNYRNVMGSQAIYNAAAHLTELYEKLRPIDEEEAAAWSAMSPEEQFEYMAKRIFDENDNLKLVDPLATGKNIGENVDMAVFFDADVILKDIGQKSSSFQIDEKLETLASVYAFYEKQAGMRFKGEDYDNAMSEVGKAMDMALEEYAGSLLGDGPYADGIDMAAVRSSLHTIYEERKDVYMQVLNDESFTTGWEGTENAWVSRSSWFISNRLQSVVANSASVLDADTETKADYNIADLKAFAVMNAMSQAESIDPCRSHESEEELGYLLGLDKAMLETMIQGGKLSEKGEWALRESYEIGFAIIIDRTDMYLDNMHKDPYAREGGYRLYNAINRNAVKRAVEVFVKMMTGQSRCQSNGQAYRSAKNNLEAVFLRKQREKYEQGFGEARYRASFCIERDPDSNRYWSEQSRSLFADIEDPRETRSYLVWNQDNRDLTMPKVFDYLNEYF